MPTDIPINEDGFEDPGAFMKSPTASLTNSASRRTTMGAPSSVGTSRRMTIGRMSQLDDGSDEDELHLGLDAALVDEEYDGEFLFGVSRRVLIVAANSTFFGVSSRSTKCVFCTQTDGRSHKGTPSPEIRVGTCHAWHQRRRSTFTICLDIEISN